MLIVVFSKHLLTIDKDRVLHWKEITSPKIGCVFVTLQIALSEDDLTVVMKILLENLGGASSQPSTLQQSIEDTQMVKKGKVSNESDSSEGMLNSVAI